MKKNKYSIIECINDKNWNSFIENTSKPNVFSISDFINLESNLKKLYILKSEEIIAAIPLILSKNCKNVIEPNFILYTPIKIRKRNDSNLSTINYENYEINNFLCEYLTNNYNNIFLKLDYTIKDIRPFLWYGYPEYKKKFNLNLRYTSELNLEVINNDILNSNFFKNCSTLIRRQIRHALSGDFIFFESYSSEVFLELIQQTFEIQESTFNSNYYKNVCRALDELHKKKLVRMYCVKNKFNKIIGCNIYSVIKDHSALIYNARSKEVDNKNYSGIYLLIKSFLELKKINIKTVDLEGINSPKRSFYKLGLGGNVESYFNIIL